MATESDIYHPDWLAYEATIGTRPVMSGNQDVDIAIFNQMGTAFASQWPDVGVALDVSDDVIQPDRTKVRIYKPKDRNPDELPLIVYFHGGGYISGNLETEDPHCRILAGKVPAVVVNVDYPLAPEHKLDHTIETAINAVNWAKDHTPPLSKSGHLIVAGGSAGASLAIQVVYSSVKSNNPQGVTGLVALFPFCAPIGAYTGKHADLHRSYDEKATGAPFLTKTVLLNMYNTPDMDVKNPAHFTLLADSLHGFPRTYVVTAEHDPCRDDGRVLAKRLNEEAEHGVKEDYYEHLPHYFHWFPTVKPAHDMMAKTVDGVRWVVEGK